jgi:hypothetical protein
MRNDMQLLERSRFSVFERELQRLLTERRGAVTLQVPVNRLLATCRDVLRALVLRREALSLKREEFEAAYQRSEVEIEGLRRQKSEELEKVRVAGETTVQTLTPQVEALPEAPKEAVRKALDEAEITAVDADCERLIKVWDKRYAEDVAGREISYGERV